MSTAPPELPASTLGQTPHEPAIRPWELELLISGALVFGVIQLPGQVDAWYAHVRPQLSDAAFMATFVGWFYVKLALYAITVGFVLHLTVRAYWVAVIGLEAVFPAGILWERTRSGPIMRELQRQATPPLQTLIDRADRTASVVFAAGLMMALFFAFTVMMGGLLGTLGFLVIWLVLGNRGAGPAAVEVIVLVWVVPLMLATLIDRRFGERLDPRGVPARMVRAVVSVAVRLQSLAFFPPLMNILFTNARRRGPLRAAMFLGVLLGGFFASKDLLAPAGGLHLDGYTFLPDDAGASGIEARYYEDHRVPGSVEGSLPSIQSDLIKDAYVRLFIPYRPLAHNELLPRHCPALRQSAGNHVLRLARPSGRIADAVLACLTALQPVTLNGRPVHPAFRYYQQPDTGVRGIITYLPVEGLPRGENVLTVAHLPRVRRSDDPPLQPYRISFWL